MKGKMAISLVVGALMVALAPIAAHAGSRGECNAILARALGTINAVERGIDVASNCSELATTQQNFILADCGPLLLDGKLFINHMLVNGASCPVTGAICDVIDTCGLIDPAICTQADTCS
jgi:hypothetical protein